ncbi:MAG: hypothetical protein SVS15_03885 [Thermodesulfobacteriota bacterium]|nr:hypothetical protein [Thermodesulfobacteriota bacterium]
MKKIKPLPSKRKSTPLRNLFLILAGVVLAYVCFEFLVFHKLLPNLALNKQEYLRKEVRILCQSSKKSAVPEKNYIALIGDSYALGNGDWLLQADHGKTSAFHSAHLIHEQTGRDVITFGRGGAGSIDGIVVEPVEKYFFINNLWGFELPPPKTALIYFYEGNDLNDNLDMLQRRYFPSYDAHSMEDPKYFRQFMDALSSEASQEISWTNNLIFGRFCIKVVDKALNRVLKKIKHTLAGDDENNGQGDTDPKNKALVEGREVFLPNILQAPALELTQKELDQALYVFEQSVAYLKGFFKDTRIVVVYTPSPLSCYDLVSDSVDIQRYKQGKSVFPSALVGERSDFIAGRVKGVAQKHGLKFIDTRQALQKAAKRQFIHGPLDWKHLNKKGHEVFAEAIVLGLSP